MAGTVADPERRTQIEIDAVVLSPGAPGERQRVLSLGEAEWNKVMDVHHLKRLQRARRLLTVKGYATEESYLTCYSGVGFSQELQDAARAERARLIASEDLYA